jgi:hypothetical protein
MPRRIFTFNAYVFLISLLLLSACRTEGGIQIVETALLEDATEGYGPYQISVRLSGGRSIDGVALYWQRPGAEQTTRVAMTPMGNVELGFVANIEAPLSLGEDGSTTRTPFALGTRLTYWVQVESEGDILRALVEVLDE